MENVVIILIIATIVSAASFYIIKTKKKGHCIGCPYAKKCGGKCGSSDTNNYL